MSSSTLENFMDSRIAGLVTGYTGSIRTAMKEGWLRGLSRAIIDDEGLAGGGGGYDNTYDEDYTLTASQTVSTDEQACTEDTYGDAWWFHRPTTNHAAFVVNASSELQLTFQSHGNDDTYNATFDGPAAVRNLRRASSLTRGQSLILRCKAEIDNPTDYDGASEWCRPGIYLAGWDAYQSSRAWVAVVLRAQNLNRKIQLLTTKGGSTTTAVNVDIAGDDTYFTGGTELELSMDCHGVASIRYRKVGAGSWTTPGSNTAQVQDFLPAAVYYSIPHGVINNLTTAKIYGLHEEIS